ncbi:MAG: InlB B-repeat-containing protein [Defluviitaleaceae bacterium]|nr:InlB B-repeat-containing protein [Defluviitaleaceae bacterium]
MKKSRRLLAIFLAFLMVSSIFVVTPTTAFSDGIEKDVLFNDFVNELSSPMKCMGNEHIFVEAFSPRTIGVSIGDSVHMFEFTVAVNNTQDFVSLQRYSILRDGLEVGGNVFPSNIDDYIIAHSFENAHPTDAGDYSVVIVYSVNGIEFTQCWGTLLTLKVIDIGTDLFEPFEIDIEPMSTVAGTAQRVVEIANREFNEHGGSLVRPNKYTRAWGTSAAWCVMFVWYVADAAGVSNTIVPKTSGAGVHEMWQFAHDNGRMIAPGNPPQIGDIPIWSNNANIGWHNNAHVNIVVAVNGDNVTTIGGNEQAGTGVEGVRRQTWNWRTSPSWGTTVFRGWFRPAYVGGGNILTRPEVITVQRSPATDNPTNGVIIGGTLVRNGGANMTNLLFEWGTSRSVVENGGGTSVWPRETLRPDSGNSSLFTATLNGLPAGTRIYYRVVAQNTVGWSHGATLFFTTAGTTPTPPPLTRPEVITVQRDPSTNNPTSGVIIGGTLVRNGGANMTNLLFEWGTSRSVVENGNGTPVWPRETLRPDSGNSSLFTATLNGLPAGTRIYYRVVAQNTVGWSHGSTLFFDTGTTPPPTHTVTFNLNGGNVSGSTANVTRSINQGTTIGETNVPIPTRANHTFDGWRRTAPTPAETTNQTRAQVGARVVNNAMTFTAQWTQTGGGLTRPEVRTIQIAPATQPVNGVRIEGHLDRNGGASMQNLLFEWGLNRTDVENGRNVTSVWPNETLRADSSNVTFSATLNGLPTGTRIYYRIVAQNTEGWSMGQTLFFTTSTTTTPTHTVTFNLNGGNVSGSTANVTRTITQGATIGSTNVPIPTRTNHTFDGWRRTAPTPAETTNQTRAQVGARVVNNAMTFTAQWTQTGGTLPSRPSIQINRANNAPGTRITFSFATANATEYEVLIQRDTGSAWRGWNPNTNQWSGEVGHAWSSGRVTSSTFNFTPNTNGWYNIYVRAFGNAPGYTSSGWVSFEVHTGARTSYLWWEGDWAQNITSNSARLSGRVFTDGTIDFVEFRYGTSERNLNRRVLASRIGANWVADLTGLSPNTGYYYELYAETTDGWFTTTDDFGLFYTDPAIQTTNPPAQRVVSGTPTVNSLTVNSTTAPAGWTTQYRIRADHVDSWGGWQNSNTFTGLAANTDYQVQARFTANNTATHQHSAESTASVNMRTAFHTTNAPAQRVVSGTPTSDSLSVNTTAAPAGWSIQLRIRTGLTGTWSGWQNSNTFTELDANTDYQVQARFAAINTNTHQHSLESNTSANIRTAQNPVTIIWNANGGSVDVATSSLIPGTAIGTLPTPTLTGWTFVGWFTDVSAEVQISTTSIVPSSNITYWAIWMQSPVTITWNANGGSVSPTTSSLIPGSAFGTLPTPTRTGWTFAGWFTDVSAGTQISYTVPSANTTYWARWVQTPITITWDANGGSVSPTTSDLIPNSAFGALPIPTRTGWTFGGWFTDETGGTQISTTTTVPSANTTYWARWTDNAVTITWNANGGTVSTTTSSLMPGSALGTLPTPTRTGWIFDGWFTTETGGTQISTTTTVPSANTTYWARWTENATTVLLGDVNNDGVINSIDALLVRTYAVGHRSFAPPYFPPGIDPVIFRLAADVNGDGVINSIDALMINMHAVGHPTLPVGQPAALGIQAAEVEILSVFFVDFSSPSALSIETQSVISESQSVEFEELDLFQVALPSPAALSIESTITPFSDAVQVSIGDVTGTPGEYVDVVISLDGNPGLVNLEMHLNFCSDTLEPVSVTGEGAIPLPVPPPLGGNPLILIFATANPLENNYQSGRLATVRFRIKDDVTANTVPLTLSGNIAMGAFFAMRTVEAEYGRVNVESSTQANPVRLSVSNVSAEPGGYVDVVINLDENPNLVSLETQLNFNSEIFQPVSITAGGTIPLPISPPLTSNPLIFIFATANPLENTRNEGELVTVRFRVDESAEIGTTSSFTLSNSIALSAFSTTSNPVNVTNGSVIVVDSSSSTDAVLDVTTVSASAGSEVTVQIRLTNNPGFASLPLRVTIPEGLTLVQYDIPENLRNDFTPPQHGYYANPQNTIPGERIPGGLTGDVYFAWFRSINYTSDSILLTLTFEIDQNVAVSTLPLNVTFAGKNGNEPPADSNGRALDFIITNGHVKIVSSRLLGSVSGGAQLTFFDATLIARYIVGHQDLHLLPGVVDFDISAGIVTPGSRELGHVRLVDAVMIARYLAGHDIVLGEYPISQT